MSLILDALRKLERERDPNQPPGVLVVGSVPWGESSRGRRLAIGVGMVAVLALAVLAGWMLRPVVKAPEVAAPTATPAPPEPRPSLSPVAPAPLVVPSEAVPDEPPVAPPIRLSKPLPPVQPRGAQASSPAASPSPAQPEPPEAPATETESPRAPATERISLTPGAADAPATAPAPGELRLNAISQRDGRRVALINDRLVYEGDSFDGIKVVRIGDTEVEVEVKGERRVLRF